MLDELAYFKSRLPVLLTDSRTEWNTLEVLYEEPRVERVWTQVGETRLYLHRIHPCEGRPLFHPHPWPSAILLLSGRQEMVVGYGDPNGEPPPIATRLLLERGSAYEMLDPFGWHSVSPLDGPSESLMITGKPWGTGAPKDTQRAQNRPLSAEVKRSILDSFLGY
jgi:hypothetical protein